MWYGSAMSRKCQTPSELEVKEVYGPADLDPAYQQKLGQPGQFPFTRGIHRDMYRGKPWTMRQYAGFGSAREANERYKFLLRQGTSGLSVAFDLPTQMGRDPDHPLVAGEVGRVGVSIATADDMEMLFADIPLHEVSVSMTINATAAILLAQYLVVAERRGIEWSTLQGTIQNDVLKEYIARGTYIYPPRAALRIVTDIFAFCAQHVPKWNTINVSGYHIREAGSTAVEEIALTLADGIQYVDAALKAGLAIDEFAPRLGFFFNCHNDFLEEVAKFRAARRLWARIMRERFGATNPRSMMLRFHTQTAGSSLTAQQPLNNVVRTTIQAMAAVCGGTQSLHTNSFDEALCLPTEESVLLALRTQQIIAHESGIAQTVDPLGGSFVVEAWTDRLESEAERVLQRIDQAGGMVRAIELGIPQAMVEQSAYRYQQRVEQKSQVIVGVNEFIQGDHGKVPLQTIDPAIEIEQRNRIQAFRKRRDAARVAAMQERLAVGARGDENLMALTVECVRIGLTNGEISDVLRGVLGEYRQGS